MEIDEFMSQLSSLMEAIVESDIDESFQKNIPKLNSIGNTYRNQLLLKNIETLLSQQEQKLL